MSRQEQSIKNSSSSGRALADGLGWLPLHLEFALAPRCIISSTRSNDAGPSAEREHQQAFRVRSNTLEECSICFEVMLKNEDLMGLPCTHNFHVKCIAPWLHEHQTCPVCRGNAD